MRAGRTGLLALALLLSARSGAGAVEVAPPGALSCSGCHAIRGGASDAVPSLAGRPAAETAAALAAFRSGERSSTLMGRIAKGFSDDEAQAIAAWLEAQR